mmetsp:Transcript_31625/g.69284  ORF Transcript_31625/g.69284 Transcript_31625/m.69284 type:complete len:365 (+) Transcript_31625:49-1143(+)|eukprot:CAMPEP_0204374304 /NCGR_PEP_ID=MMETSP0469-20131031/48566_1 /ASSEMBLY_ACC=CAM_ASM_000384 /TAXON_ID=2969 /ORGANISM="Oxyrrhis marina" /LENGTH=364 /DNA_ID=CAMNT_0051364869 /DNA_START=21 /DNA_END=1115 /DNA_ORIENTATION=-
MDASDCSLMLRNIPNRVSEAQLRAVLDTRGLVAEEYELCLPRGCRKGINVGYAFLKFESCEHASVAAKSLTAISFPGSTSSKVTEVCPARAPAPRVRPKRPAPAENHEDNSNPEGIGGVDAGLDGHLDPLEVCDEVVEEISDGDEPKLPRKRCSSTDVISTLSSEEEEEESSVLSTPRAHSIGGPPIGHTICEPPTLGQFLRWVRGAVPEPPRLEDDPEARLAEAGLAVLVGDHSASNERSTDSDACTSLDASSNIEANTSQVLSEGTRERDCSPPPGLPAPASSGPVVLRLLNLPKRVTSTGIRQLLEDSGLSGIPFEVRMPRGWRNGYAFLKLASPLDADFATDRLRGCVWEGREIEVAVKE